MTELFPGRVEYLVKAKAQFKRRSTASNVEIHIPVPKDADTPKFKAGYGTVEYKADLDSIVWKIKSFPVEHYLKMTHLGRERVCDACSFWTSECQIR